MEDPPVILARLQQRVGKRLSKSCTSNGEVRERVDFVCRCLANRAGVRLLMACMLAKIHQPRVDPRQPYTEIGGTASFSGRSYDESFITSFIRQHRLPCNSTTAFLTPALRNIDRPLSTDVAIVGRPAKMYADTLQLLADVADGTVGAEEVLAETLRVLMQIRDEKAGRMSSLLAGIEQGKDALPLSSEATVSLIAQHLACKHASRLPVLVVAAAYQAAERVLGEQALPMRSHNAADEQTGALGDVEIWLRNEDRIVTAYEMKSKKVTLDDIDRAVEKITSQLVRIDNYLFVTTEPIEETVRDYAASMYENLGGTEIAILNCLGFVRHFLHFFHRLRVDFLDAYQELLLAEPDSAVKQPLKEAFLSLRQAAEADA